MNICNAMSYLRPGLQHQSTIQMFSLLVVLGMIVSARAEQTAGCKNKPAMCTGTNTYIMCFAGRLVGPQRHCPRNKVCMNDGEVICSTSEARQNDIKLTRKDLQFSQTYLENRTVPFCLQDIPLSSGLPACTSLIQNTNQTIPGTGCRLYFHCESERGSVLECPKQQLFDGQRCSASYRCPQPCRPAAVGLAERDHSLLGSDLGRWPVRNTDCRVYTQWNYDEYGQVMGISQECPELSYFDPHQLRCRHRYFCEDQPNSLSACPIGIDHGYCDPEFAIPVCEDLLPLPIEGSGCHYFAICATDRRVARCPSGYLFEPNVHMCTSSYVCPSPCRIYPEGGFAQLPPPSCLGRFRAVYPMPGSRCTVYEECLEGIGHLRECENGTWFDPTLLACTPSYMCPETCVPVDLPSELLGQDFLKLENIMSKYDHEISNINVVQIPVVPKHHVLEEPIMDDDAIDAVNHANHSQQLDSLMKKSRNTIIHKLTSRAMMLTNFNENTNSMDTDEHDIQTRSITKKQRKKSETKQPSVTHVSANTQSFLSPKFRHNTYTTITAIINSTTQNVINESKTKDKTNNTKTKNIYKDQLFRNIKSYRKFIKNNRVNVKFKQNVELSFNWPDNRIIYKNKEHNANLNASENDNARESTSRSSGTTHPQRRSSATDKTMPPKYNKALNVELYSKSKSKSTTAHIIKTKPKDIISLINKTSLTSKFLQTSTKTVVESKNNITPEDYLGQSESSDTFNITKFSRKSTTTTDAMPVSHTILNKLKSNLKSKKKVAKPKGLSVNSSASINNSTFSRNLNKTTATVVSSSTTLTEVIGNITSKKGVAQSGGLAMKTVDAFNSSKFSRKSTSTTDAMPISYTTPTESNGNVASKNYMAQSRGVSTSDTSEFTKNFTEMKDSKRIDNKTSIKLDDLKHPKSQLSLGKDELSIKDRERYLDFIDNFKKAHKYADSLSSSEDDIGQPTLQTSTEDSELWRDEQGYPDVLYNYKIPQSYPDKLLSYEDDAGQPNVETNNDWADLKSLPSQMGAKQGGLSVSDKQRYPDEMNYFKIPQNYPDTLVSSEDYVRQPNTETSYKLEDLQLIKSAMGLKKGEPPIRNKQRYPDEMNNFKIPQSYPDTIVSSEDYVIQPNTEKTYNLKDLELIKSAMGLKKGEPPIRDKQRYPDEMNNFKIPQSYPDGLLSSEDDVEQSNFEDTERLKSQMRPKQSEAYNRNKQRYPDRLHSSEDYGGQPYFEKSMKLEDEEGQKGLKQSESHIGNKQPYPDIVDSFKMPQNYPHTLFNSEYEMEQPHLETLVESDDLMPYNNQNEQKQSQLNKKNKVQFPDLNKQLDILRSHADSHPSYEDEVEQSDHETSIHLGNGNRPLMSNFETIHNEPKTMFAADDEAGESYPGEVLSTNYQDLPKSYKFNDDKDIFSSEEEASPNLPNIKNKFEFTNNGYKSPDFEKNNKYSDETINAYNEYNNFEFPKRSVGINQESVSSDLDDINDEEYKKLIPKFSKVSFDENVAESGQFRRNLNLKNNPANEPFREQDSDVSDMLNGETNLGLAGKMRIGPAPRRSRVLNKESNANKRRAEDTNMQDDWSFPKMKDSNECEMRAPLIPDCETYGKMPVLFSGCKKYTVCEYDSTIPGWLHQVLNCAHNTFFDPIKLICSQSYKCFEKPSCYET